MRKIVNVLSIQPLGCQSNKAAGKSLEAQRIIEKLENIKTNIGKQYQHFCDRDLYVTAEKVRNAFLEYGYHVKEIPFKEQKRDFVEKFVVFHFFSPCDITRV